MIKRILKTIIPHSKNDFLNILNYVLVVILVFTVAIGFALVAFGAVWSINFILVALFGQHIATIISYTIFGAFWFFILFGDPISSRYRKMK